jgi:hypothetical protein
MLLAAFIACLLLAAYPILLYPPLVLLVARLRPRRWRRAPYEGRVAHVITVYNEERRIAVKLDNALAVQAPPGGVETIVVSDGSDDGTQAIVARYEPRGVRWLDRPRRGKERAQLDAIAATAADVIVFSDASTELEPQALVRLLEPFADPQVAAVSGTDVLVNPSGGTGEDLYVGFEMRVRRAESLAGSLVGVSGCFFAARRELCERFVPDVPSDLGTALLAIGQRLRAVAADDARCRYESTPSTEREFQRKKRTALRGLRGLLAYRAALWRGRPLQIWQVLSHKVLRFLIPLWAAAAAACLAVAARTGATWALLLLLAAVPLVALALLSVRWPALRGSRPLRALGFLVLTVAAVGAAWFGLFRQRRDALWAPTRRP